MLTYAMNQFLRKPLRFCYVVLLFTYIGKVQAQYEDRTAITLPSPNNIFTSSYLTNNVNMYTGIPNIGVPIYTLKSKELAVSLSLAYKASGIRLQDVASFAGLGWNFKAGGMVTRVIRGLPDEMEKGYIGKNKTGKEINAGGESRQDRADKIAKGDWDGEPDIFYISTPTEDLSFVFDENGVPVFNQPSRCKVYFERTNGLDDNLSLVWHLIDESGTHYIFGETASARETVKDVGNGAIESTSAWYLSKMTSFNQTDLLTFEYVQGNDISITTYNRMRVKFTNTPGCNKPDDFEATNNTSRTYLRPKYLKKIKATTGSIKFNYLTSRNDLEGGYLLAGIDIYDPQGAAPVKKYILNYDYFHELAPNKENNRVYLKNIYMASNDLKSSERLYTFKYYNNPLLKFPARNSAAFDHYGFYNNNSESTPFVPQANKMADLNKTLQYTLQSIEHAQGGKTEFGFELNTYFDSSDNTSKTSGGLRISSVKEYDNTGNVYTRSYDYRLANGRSSGEVAFNSMPYIKIASALGTGGSGWCVVTGESMNAGLIYNMSDINGVSTGYSRVKVTAPDGSSEVHTFDNFSNFPDKFNVYLSQNGEARDPASIRQFGYPTSYAYKRGLIKSKTAYDAADKPISEVNFTYNNLVTPQMRARGVSLTVLLASVVSNYYEDVYYQVSDCYRLVKEVEKTYDTQNVALFTTKTKDYTYDSTGTLIRKVSYNSSEGKNYQDLFYYPKDRNEIPGLNNADKEAYTYMKDLSVPIREEHYISSNEKEVKHSSYILQKDAGNQESRAYLSRISSGRNGNELITDADVNFDYKTGNIISEVKRDGIVNGFLWSADNSLIAKATDATGSEIYYESFEYDSTAIVGNAFAGRRYKNGSFTIPFKRPNTRKYILTYRKMIGSEWKLIVTTYSADNFVLNESVPIDDIKIYPENAQLNTYTYIPLVGMNSYCDFNNNIQYFEYDDLGNLKSIRDLNGNIVKQVNYKYACDCPYVLPLASISIRDEYVEEYEGYYMKSANVYIKLYDENSQPLFVPDLTIKSVINEKTQSSNTQTEVTSNLNGNEVLIYTGIISEYFFDSNGKPTRYTNQSFRILPGAGYRIN